jgi:drug/metabolite transporter (DMT)-like permease
MEFWVLLSLISLAANTAKVLIVKRLCAGIDSRLVVLAGRSISAAVLMPVLLLQSRSFPTDAVFWLVTLAAAVITAFASVLFTESVKKGPLALVIPAQAAVPVFTLLTLWLSSRQSPAPQAVILMLLSMAAVAWMLYANYRREDTSHRRTFFAVLSLLAAALFGVSTVLDRVAIARIAYGALAYASCWNLLSAALLAAECLRTPAGRSALTPQRSNTFPLILYGLSVLVAFYAQQLAVQYSLTIPGAVVNVKSIVMLHLPAVLLVGILFFGERIVRQAALAGIIALILGLALLRVMM